MAITPKDTFDFAVERADHLLALYDILHNSRQRGGRRDWLLSFKKLMRWPKDEAIVRIDGKDRKSLLILRESLGIDADKFAHDYISELLRAAVVSVISALDRYMHDVVVDRSWSLLSLAEDDIPNELKRLRLPVLATKKALEKLRKEKSSRPGNIVKKELQKHLHIEFTFQKKSDIEKGAKMLGVQDFWGKVAAELGGNQTKAHIQERLTEIAKRRNQIVHEADLILKMKAKQISQREITHSEASDAVRWIKNFVEALNKVFY